MKWTYNPAIELLAFVALLYDRIWALDKWCDIVVLVSFLVWSGHLCIELVEIMINDQPAAVRPPPSSLYITVLDRSSRVVDRDSLQGDYP